MYEKELKIAIQAVKKSEKTFRHFFGTKTKVQKKNNDIRNLVTFADKKIERDIKTFILNQFPAYGFIGEESGIHKNQSEMVWILDPIDGTSNFIQGLPYCAISLALYKGSEPVVAIVYNPNTKQLYNATLNGGASLNGKRISVSSTNKLISSLGGLGWGGTPQLGLQLMEKIIKKVRKIRVYSCSSLELCMVATGQYDFYVNKNIKIWDFAAAMLIVKEAGGIVTDSLGNALSEKSTEIVATNAKLHGDIKKLTK